MIVEEKKAADNLCVRGGSTFPAGCQGSRCMAWRWAVQKRMVVDPSDDAPANEYYVSETSTTHGYCGLAGRP